MRAIGRLLSACAVLALTVAPLSAVERKAPAKKPAPVEKKQEAPEPRQPGDGAPPYEAQLVRLSEIMGSLAYLRELCGEGDGGEYRARMSALLAAEATAQDRLEKLAGAYNKGFRGYQATYRSCTPNARSAIGLYLDEGGRIARDISYRYGGS